MFTAKDPLADTLPYTFGEVKKINVKEKIP